MIELITFAVTSTTGLLTNKPCPPDDVQKMIVSSFLTDPSPIVGEEVT